MYRKTKLKNGLRIITVPQKETKTVTVLVLVGAGSKYESKNISGISHFLEHMFFKGTDKRKNPMEVAEELDRVGGEYNAFTGEEYTGYYAKVNHSNFLLALDWVSDIFLNSKIPSKELLKERGVIIEEINMYKENPMMYIGDLWKKVLYGDQPAGWDIAGTPENVLSISREDIKKYRENHYTASNTIVCIAGKINEDEAIKKVKTYFSKINSNLPKEKIKVVEKQKSPKTKIIYKKVNQVNVALGVRGYNINHPHKHTLDLISVILGGSMSSRLFKEIREKLGAAYYVRTYNYNDTDSGSLVTFAGVDKRKLNKVIEVILKEYKKLTKIKVSEKELKKAKEYIKGKAILAMESSDSQASFYGMQELLKNDIVSLDDTFKKIDKVTTNDIMMMAKDIFKNEKLNMALIGPVKNKEIKL
ncbi:MAG: pitrilysin family protein [Candidatus Paceibacterota bacterium]|jgi:predicted Zn-dependent peptidase